MGTNTSGLEYFQKSVFENVPMGAVPKLFLKPNKAFRQ